MDSQMNEMKKKAGTTVHIKFWIWNEEDRAWEQTEAEQLSRLLLAEAMLMPPNMLSALPEDKVLYSIRNLHKSFWVAGKICTRSAIHVIKSKK